MGLKNGKTQEANRRQQDSIFTPERLRVGFVQGTSGFDGINSVGTNSTGCSRQNSSGASIDEREACPGKILERLEFIENAYFSYIDDHQHQPRFDAAA